jgi:sarcosine oxidase, subunit beta
MRTPVEVDVAVVGGGIMGASSALHLRAVHGKSVALIERGFIGAQASGVNFGNVRRQGRFLPQLPLAHRSREIWGRLGSLVGDDCEFIATGHLKVAYSAEEMASLEAHAKEAREWGLALELLGANTAHAQYPFLGADVVGACFSPEDGHANPRLVAPAFGRAARAAGVIVHEHVEVDGIERLSGGFRVSTKAGIEIRAEALLNTAGAWGAAIAASFGESVPLDVRGPQMSVTEPLPYFISPVLGTASAVIYLRQVKRGNVVYGGGWRGPATLDPPRGKIDPANSMRQWREVVRIVPALAGVQVIRTWSGVEGYLADDIPVMGPSATTPGLFHSFGFCGHGFQLGPGVGAVMAELVATGRSETSIEPFSVRRFAPARAAVRV